MKHSENKGLESRDSKNPSLGTNKFESDMGWSTSSQSESQEGIYQSAKDALGTTGHKIADGYQVARREFVKYESQVETLIKENPIIALCAAVGVGWAVGRLLSNRSSTTSNRAKA